jgi:hypothetical protein
MVRKFEFYEECASQWYDRLQSKDKALMRELTNDIINKPHQFLDVYSRKEYQKRSESLNALVPAESLYTLDNYIARVFYANTPAIEMLSPITGVNVGKAHESKVYSGTDYGTAKLVGAHGSFSHPPMIGMALSPAFIKALGVHAGYELSFSEIDEAGLYDIEWFYALKTAEKVGTLHDQKLCLGEACEDAEIDTTLIKGIHNYGSLQSANFGDGDNVITAQGDVRKGLFNALSSLLSVHEAGDNILISTSGYHAETLLQMDTYGVTDFSVIKRDLFDPGYIKEWWIDNNIEKDANAAGTARAMILRRGVTTAKREIVYPLQSKLMMDKQFPDDVKVMLMVMDIYKMYNANAGVICSADITATTAGFAQNGRVL